MAKGGEAAATKEAAIGTEATTMTSAAAAATETASGRAAGEPPPKRGMAGAVEVGAAQITGAEAAVEAGPAVAGTPRGQRPKPANWGSMTKAQRESWRKNAKREARRKGAGRTETKSQSIHTLSLNQIPLAAGRSKGPTANWGSMTKAQRGSWKTNQQYSAKGKRR